jgi:hypothetical protein
MTATFCAGQGNAKLIDTLVAAGLPVVRVVFAVP